MLIDDLIISAQADYPLYRGRKTTEDYDHETDNQFRLRQHGCYSSEMEMETWTSETGVRAEMRLAISGEQHDLILKGFRQVISDVLGIDKFNALPELMGNNRGCE